MWPLVAFHSLCLWFCDVFFFHMSPHQFGMAIKGGYKVVVHNIQIVLDVHIDWMVFKVDVMNGFYTILCKFLRALSSMELVVLTFSFCLVLICLLVSFALQ